MRLANQRYKEGNWQAAQDAYLEAWRVKQHFAIAANLADVEYRLGKYRDAATHLQFYLAHLPPEYEAQRAPALRRLEECRSHLIPVRVTVNVAGATVLLDGAELGEGSLAEELWLEPGQHSLEAQSPGFDGARREFIASLGESRTVSLSLARPAPPAVVKRPPPARSTFAPRPASAGDSTRTWLLIGGGALTAVAVGVGVGYAISANAAENRLRDRRSALESQDDPMLAATHSACSAASSVAHSSCDALLELRDERDNARVVSGVAFIGAGVAGSLTLAAYLLWPRDATRRESGRASTPEPVGRVRLSVRPSFGGLEWRGAF